MRVTLRAGFCSPPCPHPHAQSAAHIEKEVKEGGGEGSHVSVREGGEGKGKYRQMMRHVGGWAARRRDGGRKECRDDGRRGGRSAWRREWVRASICSAGYQCNAIRNWVTSVKSERDRKGCSVDRERARRGRGSTCTPAPAPRAGTPCESNASLAALHPAQAKHQQREGFTSSCASLRLNRPGPTAGEG